MTLEILTAALICAVLVLAISIAQAVMGSRIGSDHAVHVFLVRAIRNNGHKLFVRIPRLLNHAVIAALPLYLHVLLARLPDRAMAWAELLLNPVMSFIHILIFVVIIMQVAPFAEGSASFILAIAVVGCFAFTPQFFHALSARNFGVSSRSIGLLALSIFLFGSWLIESDSGNLAGWILALGGAFAVWAFSTFAAQVLVIILAVLAVFFGHYAAVLAAALGLGLFVAVHPRYAIGYLRHTLEFIAEYRRELAPVYILARRHSVWRDLVFDIPRALLKSPVAGLRYAYENPVLVVLVFNPLALVAAWAALTGQLPTGIMSYAGDVALAGLIAMFVTSFRATRFLGEPERYVEATTPWSALAATGWIEQQFGSASIILIAALFVVLCLMQLGLFAILLQVILSRTLDISDAIVKINNFAPGSVRFASNNEHITKLFMVNDWYFSYCIAVGRGYAGMPIGQAFEKFPSLRPSAFEHILERYRINVCVLDRAVGEEPFRTPPSALAGATLLHESQGLRIFGLNWREAAG